MKSIKYFIIVFLMVSILSASSAVFAAEVSKKNMETILTTAGNLQTSSDYDEAIKYYFQAEKLLSKYPEYSPYIYKNLAIIYATLNKSETFEYFSLYNDYLEKHNPDEAIKLGLKVFYAAMELCGAKDANSQKDLIEETIEKVLLDNEVILNILTDAPMHKQKSSETKTEPVKIVKDIKPVQTKKSSKEKPKTAVKISENKSNIIDKKKPGNDYKPVADREEIIQRHPDGEKKLVRGYTGVGSNEQKIYDFYFDKEGNLIETQYWKNGKKFGKWFKENNDEDYRNYEETNYENNIKTSFYSTKNNIKYNQSETQYLEYNPKEEVIYSKGHNISNNEESIGEAKKVGNTTNTKYSRKSKDKESTTEGKEVKMSLQEFAAECPFKNEMAKQKFIDYFTNKNEYGYISGFSYTVNIDKKQNIVTSDTTYIYSVYFIKEIYQKSNIALITIKDNQKEIIKKLEYYIDGAADNIFFNILYRPSAAAPAAPAAPYGSEIKPETKPIQTKALIISYLNNQKIYEFEPNQFYQGYTGYIADYKGYYTDGSVFYQRVETPGTKQRFNMTFFDKKGNKIWNIIEMPSDDYDAYTLKLVVKQFDETGKDINSAEYKLKTSLKNCNKSEYPLYYEFSKFIEKKSTDKEIFSVDLYPQLP